MIKNLPSVAYYKPRAVPLSQLDETTLSYDEYEAVRLADLEGLYQEEAALRMKISRPTFGRIIESAHKKIADALINGKAIKIEGGVIRMAQKRLFQCSDCEHYWEAPFGTGRPASCPNCQGRNFRRVDNFGRPARRGRWACPRRGAGTSVATSREDK
jgi:predicted DNA-binding protein (UPF0251 family)